MNISPLYEILIYLEDKRHANLNEIKSWGISVSRGVLGKMEAMHLIESVKIGDDSQLKLSKNGYDFLNSILDQIHKQTQHWDMKWRIVWFSIPEKNRPMRDRLRRHLEFLGMRPILNSLWITPLDIKEKIIKHIEKNNLNHHVFFVETEQIYGISLESILKSWNFEKYRAYYEEFMQKADKILSKHDSSNFEKKKLIFEFASILNCEPQLPIELMPKDWPKFRATLYYKRIRRSIS